MIVRIVKHMSIFDVGLAVVAGIFGYCMRRFGFPLITVVIGFILGPLAEKAFLQSLMISDGRYDIFYTQPIVIVLMCLTILTIMLPIAKSIWRKISGEMNGAFIGAKKWRSSWKSPGAYRTL